MTARAATTPTARSLSFAGVLDAATYWAGMAGIYVGYGFLWFYAFKEKLFDQNGKMPTGLAKAYDGKFIADFPGLNVTWTLLGLLELVAFLFIVGSLLRGEFLPRRAKPVLLAGLAVSMLTFGVMTFGQDVAGNTDSVGSLFTYLGVTGVIYALVRLVPPFRTES